MKHFDAETTPHLYTILGKRRTYDEFHTPHHKHARTHQTNTNIHTRIQEGKLSQFQALHLVPKAVYCSFSYNGDITNTAITYSSKFNPFIKCIKLNFIKTPWTSFDLTALWVNRSSVFICI